MNERLRELAAVTLAQWRTIPWRRVWKPALLVVVTVLMGLWFALPVDAILLRATRGDDNANSPWYVTVEDARMGLFGPIVYGAGLSGPTSITIGRISLRPRLSTLWWRPGVAFSVNDSSGNMQGNIGINGDNRDLTLHLSDVDIGIVGLGTLPLGMRANGNLGGDITLAAPAEAMHRVTGAVTLALRNIVIQVPPGLMPIDTISIPRIDLEAVADNGTLNINTIRFDGEDLNGTIRGSIKLQTGLSNSHAQLEFRFRLGPNLADGLAPLLPLAGFRRERDVWVRSFKGPLSKLLAG